MVESDLKVLSPCRKRMLWVACIAVFLCFVCLLFGALLAARHNMKRNLRNSLTNTTCLLVNYTVSETQCGVSTGQGIGVLVPCSHETFQFQYSIADQKQIISELTFTDSSLNHRQTRVGADSLFKYQTRSFSCLDRAQVHMLLRQERSHLCSFGST